MVKNTDTDTFTWRWEKGEETREAGRIPEEDCAGEEEEEEEEEKERGDCH